MWSRRIFPSLPGSRPAIFYRDASSAILQPRQPMVEFYILTYVRTLSATEARIKDPILPRIELTMPCTCCCCCCCLHIKSRSGLYSVLSNIRTGPTDADAFRGHRLTTQKGYTYQKEIKGPRKVNTHAIIGK